MTKMIEAEGLTKTFPAKGGPVEAVRGLDLEVTAGELVAFLGPNGAGKSTTLRLLTTLASPTRGSARVVGHDIARAPAQVRRRIGYVGQGNSGGHSHRVRDELLSQGAFHGLGRAVTRARTDELIESLELSAVATRTVGTLSGGQRRRLDIALGILHAPRLLFLDEPSTGLDPQSRANLWRHIVRLRDEHGTTVFLTTHYLDEADQLAERVMVMDAGRVVADDSSDALKREVAGDRIRLGFDDERDALVAADRARVAPGVRSVGAAGCRVEIVADEGDRLLPSLVVELAAAGVPPATARIEQPTLDDVFLALTGRTLREHGAADDATASDTTPTFEETAA